MHPTQPVMSGRKVNQQGLCRSEGKKKVFGRRSFRQRRASKRAGSQRWRQRVRGLTKREALRPQAMSWRHHAHGPEKPNGRFPSHGTGVLVGAGPWEE